MRCRSGFTVPEILAVIAIIVIILSMLMPTLARARETARKVVCLSQLTQLSKATIVFATDHERRLPGVWDSVWVNRSIPGGGCWLSNPPAGQTPWQAAPETGELFEYVNRDATPYRCPSIIKGVLNSGVGSNGKFDYSAFHSFAGTKMFRLPGTASVPTYGTMTVRTPWLIEESPWEWLNRGQAEGGFGGGDKIGNWHNGGGNLASLDGSGLNIPNTLNLTPSSFLAVTPSGATVTLNSHVSGFGGWATR